MDNCKCNKSIECSVSSCKYHSNTADYCALDTVKIGTHECNPTVSQCIDCLSFEKK